MAVPQNQAAWLIKAGEPLKVDKAPMPSAGPNEIVVKNAAVAINPLDTHMQDVGVFVQNFPAIFGCDVAGEVYETGPGVERFQKGDRVIDHTINLVTGQPRDGAYALYSVVRADKAAILPDNISYNYGVVLPFAIEAAVCAISLTKPGVAMPGVSTPALGLPYPSLESPIPVLNKTLIVYGGSSSVGSVTIQLATAAGIHVVAISGAHNYDFTKTVGAAEVFGHKDPALVAKVVSAVNEPGHEFVGIFDAISTPQTYKDDLVILSALGGGHLACVHPPLAEGLPSNVQAGMIFAVNDIAGPVFREYVTPALQSGKLLALPPPTIVGQGLGSVNEALNKCRAGVSATKLVVEL